MSLCMLAGESPCASQALGSTRSLVLRLDGGGLG